MKEGPSVHITTPWSGTKLTFSERECVLLIALCTFLIDKKMIPLSFLCQFIYTYKAIVQYYFMRLNNFKLTPTLFAKYIWKEIYVFCSMSMNIYWLSSFRKIFRTGPYSSCMYFWLLIYAAYCFWKQCLHPRMFNTYTIICTYVVNKRKKNCFGFLSRFLSFYLTYFLVFCFFVF